MVKISDLSDMSLAVNSGRTSFNQTGLFNSSSFEFHEKFNCFLGYLARLHEVHRAIAVTPVVHVPVPVPVPVRVPVRVRITLALKFSRSPYLDNHSSESIHTWTIDTL